MAKDSFLLNVADKPPLVVLMLHATVVAQRHHIGYASGVLGGWSRPERTWSPGAGSWRRVGGGLTLVSTFAESATGVAAWQRCSDQTDGRQGELVRVDAQPAEAIRRNVERHSNDREPGAVGERCTFGVPHQPVLEELGHVADVPDQSAN